VFFGQNVGSLRCVEADIEGERFAQVGEVAGDRAA
jgi:hypothetical protein